MIKFLQFLRIADQNGQLSITNLCVLGAAANFIFRSDLPVESIVALLGTLLSYQAKRFVESKKPTTDEDSSSEIEQIWAAIASLPQPTNYSNEFRADIERLQDRVSSLSVAAGLKGNK